MHLTNYRQKSVYYVNILYIPIEESWVVLKVCITDSNFYKLMVLTNNILKNCIMWKKLQFQVNSCNFWMHKSLTADN